MVIHLRVFIYLSVCLSRTQAPIVHVVQKQESQKPHHHITTIREEEEKTGFFVAPPPLITTGEKTEKKENYIYPTKKSNPQVKEGEGKKKTPLN